MKTTKLALALAAIASAATSFSATAADHVYSNASPISINGDPGTPYPSTITVAGLSGGMTRVQVTLHGFSHSYARDVDVLLVAPSGEKIMLMSDTGGGDGVSGIELNFSADAAAFLPPRHLLPAPGCRPTSTTLIPKMAATMYSRIRRPAGLMARTSPRLKGRRLHRTAIGSCLCATTTPNWTMVRLPVAGR